jgi:hypothetical protein
MLRASERKARVPSLLNGVERGNIRCGDPGWKLNLNCSSSFTEGVGFALTERIYLVAFSF